jgi:hypothetical protein
MLLLALHSQALVTSVPHLQSYLFDGKVNVWKELLLVQEWLTTGVHDNYETKKVSVDK